MIIKLDIPQKANLLFDHCNETIIWSCLQGIMGEIYADNGERPMSAMAVLGISAFWQESQTVIWFCTDRIAAMTKS